VSSCRATPMALAECDGPPFRQIVKAMVSNDVKGQMGKKCVIYHCAPPRTHLGSSPSNPELA
jgi:hypothetical protein